MVYWWMVLLDVLLGPLNPYVYKIALLVEEEDEFSM